MFVPHLLMMIMHPTDPRDLLHYMHHQRFDFIRTVRDDHDSQMKYRYNAIALHKLKALLASSLASTNCKRLSIMTVERCGLTIAHAYFGFEESRNWFQEQIRPRRSMLARSITRVSFPTKRRGKMILPPLSALFSSLFRGNIVSHLSAKKVYSAKLIRTSALLSIYVHTLQVHFVIAICQTPPKRA